MNPIGLIFRPERDDELGKTHDRVLSPIKLHTSDISETRIIRPDQLKLDNQSVLDRLLPSRRYTSPLPQPYTNLDAKNIRDTMYTTSRPENVLGFLKISQKDDLNDRLFFGADLHV